MPQKDPGEACALVAKYLRDVPAWPQLPHRSFREDLKAQYSEGFPGVVVEGSEKKIYVDHSREADKPLERLYTAYLENDFAKYPIGPDYAAGLHQFLSLTDLSPLAVKGQVTGPVTWGLTVTDENRKVGILYQKCG